MVEGHKPIEIIRLYTAYYLKSIDYPLLSSPQEGTLYWGIEMAIKFSDDQILVYCNICGKTVYKALKAEKREGEWGDITRTISDYYPTIQETYKVYCELCYMAPLKKIIIWHRGAGTEIK